MNGKRKSRKAPISEERGFASLDVEAVGELKP